MPSSIYEKWIDPKSLIFEISKAMGLKGDVDEDSMLIAFNEAANYILTKDTLKEFVSCTTLYNYKTALPPNFKFPTQVAYRSLKQDDCPSTLDVKRYFIDSVVSNKQVDVHISACSTCKETVKCCCETNEWFPIEVDADYVKLSKNPILGEGYSKFMYGVVTGNKTRNNVKSVNSHFALQSDGERPQHKSKTGSIDPNDKYNINKSIYAVSAKCPYFQLVRPTSNYLFNLPSELKACNVPAYDTNLEYRIDDGVISLNNYVKADCGNCDGCRNSGAQNRYNGGDYVGVSHGNCVYNYEPDKDGQVLISYLGHRMNDEGFLLIPDNEHAIKAVKLSAMEAIAFMQYSMDKTRQNQQYYLTIQQSAFRARVQAKTKLRIPNSDVWNQFLTNHWLKRLPNYNMGDSNRLTREVLPQSADYYKSFYINC